MKLGQINEARRLGHLSAQEVYELYKFIENGGDSDDLHPDPFYEKWHSGVYDAMYDEDTRTAWVMIAVDDQGRKRTQAEATKKFEKVVRAIEKVIGQQLPYQNIDVNWDKEWEGSSQWQFNLTYS